MKSLFILNDAPHGSERTYNGLRLAGSLARQHDLEVKLFLIGDAVTTAKRGQKVPPGYYNTQTMLEAFARHGGQVGVCGSCLDARGLSDPDLLEGTRRSSMEELTSWTVGADKIITF